MIIADLIWDSNFFKKRIASVLLEYKDIHDIKDLLSSLKSKGYDLVYLSVEGGEDLEDCYRENLVDKKVIYFSKITERELSPYIFDYDASPAPLYSLSRQAGEYSRFKKDSNFGQNDFYRFYDAWIENSIKKEIADVVYIYIISDSIKGLITGKVRGNKMVIGLLSVADGCRGLGIGTALIKHLNAYSNTIGIKQLEVATQLENINACKFYEKNDMKQKSITSIYHFWLNEFNTSII